MSFILDALRKSDQQRQRGATPTLLTAPALAAEAKKPAYWIQGLIAAVLVGAGIVIGWVRPWQQEQAAAGRQHVASVTAAQPREPAPRQAVLTPLPPLPETSTAPAQDAATQKPALAAASPAAESRGTAEKPVAEKAASAADAAPEQKVISMSELPAAIRQELPPMQILLHQYSPRPANRFVTINNQTLQEGESVAPGLTLEQITRDGMVLSYRGFRFRRGVP